VALKTVAPNGDPEPRRRDLSCAQVRDALPLLVGEELDAPVAAATRSHLTSCHACARELGGYLQARRALKSVSAVGEHFETGPCEEFFSELQTSILAQIAREAARETAREEITRKPTPLVRSAERRAVALRRIVASAAMAALFVVGLGLVWWLRPSEPRLLGNEPMAVPIRSSSPGSESSAGLENLSRRKVAARPAAAVPRFGLQARADSQQVLEAQEARALLRAVVRAGR